MNDPMNYDQLLRYCRHVLLPEISETGQTKLLNAHVLVIGAGGLGCAVLPYLTASGVGSITLLDGDTVAIHNLQRQVLHGEIDVNENKAISAGNTLKTLNSHCQLQVIPQYFDKTFEHLIQQADVVADCSDNLKTRQLINQLCWQHKTPLVSGAAIRLEGQLISFTMAPNTPCYACMSHYFKNQQLSCVESGILSPVVGTIGTLQATEVIKFITQSGEICQDLLIYDAAKLSFNRVKVPILPQCNICSNS